MHPKALVVPFSSVGGSSVTLHGPTGVVIGQLAILNVGGDTPEDWKQRSIAIATDVAHRINQHDELMNSNVRQASALEAAKEREAALAKAGA